MAIFANGPATQTSTVTTTASTVPVFNVAATGLSGTLRNVLVINTGTATAYVGGSTAVTVAALPLASGDEMLLQGPAVDLYALTAAGTTTLVAGLGSQVAVD